MSDRLEQLYDAALELPRDARASFIATACHSDAALRSELLSLVSAAEAAEGFFATLGRALFSPTLAESADEGDSPHTDSRTSPRGVTQSNILPEGTVIGRYQIAGQLGIGGMGTVFRAYDTRLDRQVALKFLAPHLTRDPEAKERLLLEARAAAALQHPNVCVVHEIGDTPDGQPFIAMALCEGDTLKHRLASGPIAPEEAVAIAAQVARALSAAHSRKIIHRDVKPGNIILETDGTVKLLDFGLAKLSVGSVTRPGHTPGTIAYMSPEQVRGDPVDHRSDLWSLGVVLYEMLAGRRPFRGENDRIVLQVILDADPEPLRTVGADVPARVASVVERLLCKNRESRYASAAAVLTDLEQTLAEGHGPVESETTPPRRRPGAMFLVGVPTLLAALAAAAIWSGERSQASRSAAAPSREPSIAVLPLANLSADSGNAALAVGMTEELISTLARAGGVRVIASTSTSGFRDRNMDVRQIADSLGVSNILEGGIQKSGSQLRVEVRLIAASDGATLWSQAYSREFKDMFSVQDEIVQAVGGELGMLIYK